MGRIRSPQTFVSRGILHVHTASHDWHCSVSQRAAHAQSASKRALLTESPATPDSWCRTSAPCSCGLWTHTSCSRQCRAALPLLRTQMPTQEAARRRNNSNQQRPMQPSSYEATTANSTGNRICTQYHALLHGHGSPSATPLPVQQTWTSTPQREP
jgi:hypothetical protein